MAEGVGGGAAWTSSVPSSGSRPRRRRRSRSSPALVARPQVRAHLRRCRTAARARGSRRRRPRCPAWVAIQPAWRPITSTTITRLCDSAVVCRRSIASVTICTAVWKPNVKSVPPRSLSIVLGTPTTGTPCSVKRERHAERVLAADRDQRVDARAAQRRGGSRRARPRPRRTGWCATCQGSCRRAGGCPRCSRASARSRRPGARRPSRGETRRSCGASASPLARRPGSPRSVPGSRRRR